MFELRFPKTEILEYATRYEYPNEDVIMQEIAPQIRQQQFVAQEQLVVLCNWKSPRIRTRCAANDPEFVKSATQTAFHTSNEQLRVEVLTLLSGVGWPMASVLLHWGHVDPYPILDFRALWSLGFDVLPHYNFEFWWAYTQFCRQLAQEAGVSMRTLDRALWQYSKENQP
ncbi:MAG: hypothetical protein KC434_03875 [Anaerolineales bacterium]|nr:hypothetical protein [Anaerolineales bacterium]